MGCCSVVLQVITGTVTSASGHFGEDKISSEMMGVLGHDSALVRLYWAGDN